MPSLTHMYIRQTKTRTIAIAGAHPITGYIELDGEYVAIAIADIHCLETYLTQDPLMSMEMVYAIYEDDIIPGERKHNTSAIMDCTPSVSEAYIGFIAAQALARNNKSPPMRASASMHN